MLHYDKDCDGNIIIDHFLKDIRGTPISSRQDVIDKAFAKFDRQNQGFIDITDVR